MANPFDQFDAPEANPFDQFDAPKPKSPVSGGLVAAAKQAIGGTIKGAGQAAADFLPGVDQDNALKRYGQGVVDANPTAVSSLADLKDKPLTGIAEATGNAGGSMGAMLGARALGMGITAASPLAGPAAPLIAGLGQAVSWAGPAAAAALPSFGGIREKQIQDDPARRDSVGSKLLAAAGAGTVGAIESKFGPNKWAEMALSKQGRDALAEKFVANSLVGSIAKGAAKGAAIEGGEELAQNPIEQLASYQNPLTAENLKDTAFSGVMGALGGGVLGGASGAAFRGNPAKPGQNPDVIPVDQPIPYTPTTVEEVAKARAEAMGIKPENGPLSVASGMAIEGQTAEEMRLSTPGILAQGAAVAEQSRIEQEARQAAEPGIPYDPVAVDDLNGKPATQAAKEASPSPSGSFSQMDELAQLIGQEKADKQSRLADIGAQQQAAQSAADAYREDRLAEINQTVADNRQRQAETARLDLLHGILSDAEVANPAAKFGAELARQGYRNAEATPQEAAAIQRHEDLTQAFKGWQNPATQGPKEGFMQMQDSADFYGLLGREKADLAQRRAALQKPESVPQKKDKHQAVADLVAAGASMKGRDLVSPTGKVVMKNLNLTQAAKARQFIRERNTNPTPPNAQTAETPAPAQAVQAEAQGSQQQSAVDQPAQQEAQNVSTLRPATEGDSEGSYPQGSVDARSVGNLRADRGSGTGGQAVRNDAAEPAASVPDSRAGGSSERVAEPISAPYKLPLNLRDKNAALVEMASLMGKSDKDVRESFSAMWKRDGRESAEKRLVATVERLRAEKKPKSQDSFHKNPIPPSESTGVTQKGLPQRAGSQASVFGNDGRADRRAKAADATLSRSDSSQLLRAENEDQIRSPVLESYSEQDLAARDEAQRLKAEEKSRKDKAAEDRARADSERDSFTLTGSDRAADVQAAQGQGDIFDQPAAGFGSQEPDKAESRVNDRPDIPKPPDGVYKTLSDFEADTAPLNTLARLAASLSGIKEDWRTHTKTLGQVLDSLKVTINKDWQHQKEMSDPAFARAYRSAFNDGWRVTADIQEIVGDNQNLNLLDKVRGPFALDFISRISNGEKGFRLESYVSDSKPYSKVKPSRSAKVAVSAKPSANQNPIKTETRANTGPGAETESANQEPNPLDFTPKQYHDARMKWVAREYGLSDAEVRSDYDTDAARKADDGAWTEAVRQAFKDGAELSRATLDKLEETRPGALSAFLHDYPDAKVPNGYQTPSSRKAESEKQDALRSDRKAIAEEFAANKPLESIFAGLDSSSVRKANKAKKAAKAHPLADKIQNVQDNFLDILQELEDSGKVKINC